MSEKQEKKRRWKNTGIPELLASDDWSWLGWSEENMAWFLSKFALSHVELARILTSWWAMERRVASGEQGLHDSYPGSLYSVLDAVEPAVLHCLLESHYQSGGSPNQFPSLVSNLVLSTAKILGGDDDGSSDTVHTGTD